ncbi:MAG: DNA recombination protein RmuC [Tepidisphaeraceae bacterium]|jgi:DNA recombination protein RmuC
MIYVLGIAGLLVGIVIGALAGSRKSKVALAVAQQRLADLAQQLAGGQIQTQSLRDSLADSERNLAAARTQFAAAERNLVEQRELISHAQEQLRLAFSSASAEALARNNEAFLQLAKERFATISAEAVGSLDQRKEQIDAMLRPLRELMDQYQLRVGEIEKSRVESYSMLREQLGTLAETQRTLNTQTSQLVTALSRPTVRGQWGEISLRRLVELAGLTNKCDFVEQGIVDGEQGRLKPDMVVSLPGQRDVVIDCKTSLDAFLDAAAATDEDTRRSHLQRHAQQVRSRARELSGKSYWSQFSRSPEYVIMFLPGEAFLYAAVEQDASLVEDCIRNHVLLATPTTLIALLKTIEFGWRQEAISENAEQIRSLGVELYERIGTILGHVAKLGSNLNSAVVSYNQTIGSLESRVLPTTRKMAELGAHTGKELPQPELIERLPREIPALTSDSPP